MFFDHKQRWLVGGIGLVLLLNLILTGQVFFQLRMQDDHIQHLQSQLQDLEKKMTDSDETFTENLESLQAVTESHVRQLEEKALRLEQIDQDHEALKKKLH